MDRTERNVVHSLQRFGLQRDRMRAALAHRVGIGASELDALEHLEADGPFTQRELGRRLALTSGAITMLVDRLEAAGLVYRRPHPSDRRFTLLELTQGALAQLPEAFVRYHLALQTLASGLTKSESEAIRSFLRAAADAAAATSEDLGGVSR